MDPAAERYEKIYREHQKLIWGYVARRASGLDVGAIVGDVFLALWEQIDGVSPEKMTPWLIAVARNKVRLAIRDKKPAVPLQRDAMEETRPVEDHAAVTVADLRFEEMLDSLDDDLDREIAELIGWSDLGPTDIAKALGIKRSTVSMRMKRMRGKLSAFRPGSDEGRQL